MARIAIVDQFPDATNNLAQIVRNCGHELVYVEAKPAERHLGIPFQSDDETIYIDQQGTLSAIIDGELECDILLFDPLGLKDLDYSIFWLLFLNNWVNDGGKLVLTSGYDSRIDPQWFNYYLAKPLEDLNNWYSKVGDWISETFPSKREMKLKQA